jgi:hypothetical protein
MLGMILGATMPTLVFGEIARAAVLDERASSRLANSSASEGIAGCEQVRKAAAFTARSAPAMSAPPICRTSRRKRVQIELLQRRRFVGFDEDGGSPANIAASGASQ